MCADGFETKSPTDLSLDDILREMKGLGQAEGGSSVSRSEEVQAILNQFVAARVLIHTDDDKYNLVHDYLASYVRTATEGTETNVERANRLLKRSIAEYKEDPKTRISFGRLRWIEKFASPEVKSGDKARELIRKSKLGLYVTIARVALIALFVLLLPVYIFSANSYYLSLEEFIGDSSRIVVRSGHPQLKFIPGFDDVVIRTDFTLGDLDAGSKARDDILREQLTGFWLKQSQSGYEQWAEQLVIRLSPIPQVRALRLLGQPERAVELALFFLTDPQADIGMHRVAAQLLGELAQANPQSVTPDVIRSLHDIAVDPQADVYLRLSAANSLGQIAISNPGTTAQVVTPNLLRTLTDITKSPSVATQAPAGPKHIFEVSASAASTLGTLIQASPEAATQVDTPGILQALIDISRTAAGTYVDYDLRLSVPNTLLVLIQADPQAMTSDVLRSLLTVASDPDFSYDYQRIFTPDTLQSLLQANPQAVTPGVLQTLIDIITNSDTATGVRINAQTILAQIAQADPEAATTNMLQALIDVVTDTKADPDLRGSAVNALGQLAQAKPQAVTASMLQALIDTVTDAKADSNLRDSAAYTLRQFAQANPRAVTASMLQALIDTVTDAKADSNLRDSAAYTLRQLAQANPQAVTNSMRQALIDIVTDPQADSGLRYGAAYALWQLAQANPQAVTTSMLQALVDIVTDAKADFYLRYSAVYALGQLGQANPQAVTASMWQALIDIVTDAKADSNLRYSAVNALGQLGQANPEAVTSGMLQALTDIVYEPGATSDLRYGIIYLLGTLVEAVPQAATPRVIRTLSDILTDPYIDSNPLDRTENALRLLARTRMSETLETLSALAKQDKDHEERRAGAYALFVIALGDPGQTLSVRDELDQLRHSSQSYVRLATSKALEMTEIGDLLLEAQARPEDIVLIRARLNALQSSPEEHLRFAASVVLREIDDLKANTWETP